VEEVGDALFLLLGGQRDLSQNTSCARLSPALLNAAAMRGEGCVLLSTRAALLCSDWRLQHCPNALAKVTPVGGYDEQDAGKSKRGACDDPSPRSRSRLSRLCIPITPTAIWSARSMSPSSAIQRESRQEAGSPCGYPLRSHAGKGGYSVCRASRRQYFIRTCNPVVRPCSESSPGSRSTTRDGR
jgi:hypothetical protein